MGDAVTYMIELGVGIVTVAIGVLAWQRRTGPFGVVAVVLAVAGTAAVVHAVSRLV